MREFKDIESFVAHLGALAVAEEMAMRHTLDKCAALVEKTAKNKIGEYQQQTGPFIAWPELSDFTKRDRERQGYPEDEPLLRTGELRDSISRTLSVETLEAQIGSNSDIAVYQELGTKHIPPRSFLGGAMADSVEKIKEITGTSIVAALVGEEVVAGGIAIEG